MEKQAYLDMVSKHTEKILDLYREAIDAVFYEMAQIVKQGGSEAVLHAIGGPVCQSGFKRLIT